MYYHSDVTGLLLHPYVRACDPAAAGLAAEILRRQSIYVRRSMLVPGSVMNASQAEVHQQLFQHAPATRCRW